jgi:hypothetical protein
LPQTNWQAANIKRVFGIRKQHGAI